MLYLSNHEQRVIRLRNTCPYGLVKIAGGHNTHEKGESMKKILFLALVAALSMTIIACGNDDDDTGPTGGNASIPGTADGSLSFSNQQVWTYNMENHRWAHYTGSRTGITCQNFGGTGSITNGRFNFSITSIEGVQLSPLVDVLWIGLADREDLTISVEGALAGRLRIEDLFRRGYGNRREVSNGYNFRQEWVQFIYVDRDVTVSSPGGTYEGSQTEDGFTRNDNITTRAFSVDLQRGWNALLWEVIGSVRRTAASQTENITYTLRVGNPDRIRWVIDIGY